MNQETAPILASNPHKWTIYKLSDPLTGLCRYVGKTINVTLRLSEHIRRSRSNVGRPTHNDHWIRLLLSVGVDPVLEELEQGEGTDTWQEAEKRWIAFYKEQGANLTNIREGGNGSGERHTTEETKALISVNLKGHTVSDETRRRIGEANKGRKKSPELLEAMSKARMGHKLPQEQIERMRAKQLGKVRTPEQCANMVEAWKKRGPRKCTEEMRAKWSENAKTRLHDPEVEAKRSAACRTEEYRERQSAAQTGRVKSPEEIEKFASKLRGRKKSQETIARMSAAQAARRERARALAAQQPAAQEILPL